MQPPPPPPPSGPPPPQQHSQYSYATNGPPPAEGGQSLPPIHHFETAQQGHHPSGPYTPMTMPTNLPPPQYPYAVPSSAGPPRFAIPQLQTDRNGNGSRKDQRQIKRRTKTGCLTCRKRRIKCDEGQPACRNCLKSKRECLGYDLSFIKSNHPHPIQPALGVTLGPGPGSSSSSITGPPGHPGVNSSYSSHPYQPPTHFTSPGGSGGGGGSGSSSSFIPSASPNHHAEYRPPSLDPALTGGEAPLHSMVSVNYPGSLQPLRLVKHVTMDDLFALGDVQPQFQTRDPPPSISSAAQQEIADFYSHHYGPGLDKLLDTEWYCTNGLSHLQQNLSLLDFLSQCVDLFRSSPNDDATRPSLEARLVWQLACLPRLAARGPAGRDPLVQDLLARLDTLENLLTGQHLEPHRIPLAPQVSHSASPSTYHVEQVFWHNLGRLVSARDDTLDAHAAREVSESLNAMRNVLGVENRDVLYSLAIGRHVGGRMPEFHPKRHLVASSNDPKDDHNKLKVAHHFIELEDSKGSSQVIQRLCSMGLRSWAMQKQ